MPMDGFKHCHLQNLVTLFLTTGKADIDRTFEHVVADVRLTRFARTILTKSQLVYLILPGQRALAADARQFNRRQSSETTDSPLISTSPPVIS